MFSKFFLYPFYILITVIIILIGYLISMAEYEAVKKHFPEMSFYEYVLTSKKIRIVPK